MSTTQLPIPEGIGECEYGACPYDGDSDSEARELRRCATCKYQNYCSERCQREDWKQHKYQCSSLIVDPAKAFLPADPEELEALTAFAERWLDAFQSLDPKIRESRTWRAITMPESQELLKLDIKSSKSYSRDPQLHKTKPFRKIIIVIARRFPSDLVLSLSDEAKQVIGDYVTTSSRTSPHGFCKLYGAKIMAKPADLAPEEYVDWMALYPVIGVTYGAKYGFKEWMKRWAGLLKCRNGLWNE